MKKALIFILLFSLLFCSIPLVASALESPFTVDARSAILMEASSGTVLFEQNADEPLPPASVTKVMTMLLVMEAIDAGKLAFDSQISVSEHAASMGGSQVYLKVGESMTLEDMLKSVVIASANDAAVALAEAVAGSEELFVSMMNERADELGMHNTHFENTNGLDDTAQDHVTSARDIAIMSRELITKHPKILEYSSIWMDTIRGGEFTLTNTNRLVRFYSGATGLKTGSTSKAKFCISATAERDGMSLIAVIMGSPSRDTRNEAAKSLLDYGFANYALYRGEKIELLPLKTLGGDGSLCEVSYDMPSFVLEKSSMGNVTTRVELPESLTAPIAVGEQVGRVVYELDGQELTSVPIRASNGIERITFGELLLRMLSKMALSN